MQTDEAWPVAEHWRCSYRQTEGDDDGDAHDDMRRPGQGEPDEGSTFDELVSIAFRSGQGGIWAGLVSRHAPVLRSPSGATKRSHRISGERSVPVLRRAPPRRMWRASSPEGYGAPAPFEPAVG